MRNCIASTCCIINGRPFTTHSYKANLYIPLSHVSRVMQPTTTPADPPAPKSYNFSPVDMKNTKIFNNQPALPLYSVVTDLKSDKRTEIFDARADRLLARIERNNILPDTITFPSRNDGSSINLSRWLQKGKLEDGQYVSWHRYR